ncbi:MAG: pyridoxal-phosphate dependent enzyme [Chroococcidiopsidaceae cyanobacterium CP_BM_ER_R8_30]|nr:pyridoxal-phosphate dependent enzyme [Chroococcidiopsidaceae cyanobacterium CP_BM_ER_R8_30]
MPQHYKVKCQFCGIKFDDDGFILDCPAQHPETALLMTEYSALMFEPNCSEHGISRYHNWLPIRHHLYSAGRTVTYQSQKLSQRLGLPNLWIAFNGYCPEKGAMLVTSTFKELEAYTVVSRLGAQHTKTLVVASAGNTAAAFASVCSHNKVPCLIIVPESGLHRLKFTRSTRSVEEASGWTGMPAGDPQATSLRTLTSLDPVVKIVSLVGADYDDAIKLATSISQLDGFFQEGGVKNIGRRDGMGTTMLSAVETIGQLPDYYFQAIGSGAGAIAVHEAAKRLIADGRFGQKLPQLMLSQNFPFIPIYHAWKSQQRQLQSIDISKQQVKQIVADVLSNQRPPYAVIGGVFDVLKESQGDMFFANNQETLQAIDLFQETEGIALDPAAGVALATLIKASKYELIDCEAHILLHITGGRCHNSNQQLYLIQPSLQLTQQELFTQKTLEKVLALF